MRALSLVFLLFLALEPLANSSRSANSLGRMCALSESRLSLRGGGILSGIHLPFKKSPSIESLQKKQSESFDLARTMQTDKSQSELDAANEQASIAAHQFWLQMMGGL